MPLEVTYAFAPDSWSTIEWKLRRGELPTDKEIAIGLRGDNPIPRMVRNYIADRLLREVKLPRGVRPDEQFEVLRKYYLWCTRVRRWQTAYKFKRKRGWRSAPPRGTPYEVALEKVSEESGISEKTLKKALRRLGV